jgi:hypothetical protein
VITNHEIGGVVAAMHGLHGIHGPSPRTYEELIAELFLRVQRLERAQGDNRYESDCGDTPETQDCGGTLDPERGCICV